MNRLIFIFAVFASTFVLPCSAHDEDPKRYGRQKAIEDQLESERCNEPSDRRSPAKVISSPSIVDFLLYAERSIQLGRHDIACGGDIGVRTIASNPTSQLNIDAHAFVDISHNLIAPSVTLKDDTRVGTVQTNTLNGQAGVGNSFPMFSMPALPLGRLPTIGNTDMTVERNKEYALVPGSYGALDVQGILLLTAGEYSFSEVKLGEFAQLIAMTGNVRINIANKLTTGPGALISSAPNIPAGGLYISVAGADGTEKQYAVSLGSRSKVRAVLSVPHGTLALADEVHAKGAFVGFDIHLGNGVHLDFQSGLTEAETKQHGQQQLSRYFTVPSDPSITPLVGPVPPATQVHLAIGLLARDSSGLRKFADQVSDPKNPKYRQYLTVDQFAQTFGATAPNYHALIQWVQSTGLKVENTYRNNLLVSVSGTAAQIEQGLYMNLVYRLRKDGSTFVTVDREPSMDSGIPILRISGLNEVIAPYPMVGSGPGGVFGGNDFRAAYAPGIPETGTGQTVAIFAQDGFDTNDIAAYKNLFNLPDVPIQAQLVHGFNGKPSGTDASGEVSVDIEMVISIAPGLDAVIVYEGPRVNNGSTVNSVFNAIAAPPAGVPLSRQISSSFPTFIDDNTRQILAEYAVQGQSFFHSSGDSGASTDPLYRDLPFTTLVGGTELSMNGSGSSWQSETTWVGSGGGILTSLPIPDFQKTVDMSKNGGSTQFRNVPDVSMVATGILAFQNGQRFCGPGDMTCRAGTSLSAPLWAGYMALVNQRAQNNGKGPVGYANPLLYSIGQSAAMYPNDFHDINDGSSNTFTGDTSKFSAVTGYDLATGWGTPTANLVSDLSGVPTAGTTVVTIHYHQVGACNGYHNNFGGVNAGPNAAFVIFGIEGINNPQGSTAYNFDPSKLYVQQAKKEFLTIICLFTVIF